MKKMLIILAGAPAVGKSYFSHLVLEKFGNVPLLSPDTAQEMYADRFGYKNSVEKREIYNRAFELFYDMLAYNMHEGQNLILIDYPFSEKQRGRISEINDFYGYNILTVRFSADFDVLYERRKIRDISLERHPVYLTESYQFGEKISKEKREELLISKEDFRKKIEDSAYDKFVLGETVEVDTTHFSEKLERGLKRILVKIEQRLLDK